MLLLLFASAFFVTFDILSFLNLTPLHFIFQMIIEKYSNLIGEDLAVSNNKQTICKISYLIRKKSPKQTHKPACSMLSFSWFMVSSSEVWSFLYRFWHSYVRSSLSLLVGDVAIGPVEMDKETLWFTAGDDVFLLSGLMSRQSHYFLSFLVLSLHIYTHIHTSMLMNVHCC